MTLLEKAIKAETAAIIRAEKSIAERKAALAAAIKEARTS